MATLPPEMILSRSHAAPAGAPGDQGIDRAWAALHEQADCLATLARIGAEPAQVSAGFGGLMARAQPWQHNLVIHGIDDIAAMLTSGLGALATLSARGQDTAAPALALWREFHAARAALLAVLSTATSD